METFEWTFLNGELFLEAFSDLIYYTTLKQKEFLKNVVQVTFLICAKFFPPQKRWWCILKFNLYNGRGNLENNLLTKSKELFGNILKNSYLRIIFVWNFDSMILLFVA